MGDSAPAPSGSVRVRTETLDRFLASVGEVILSTNQLRTAAGDLPRSARLEAGFDRIERRVGELQRRGLELRTAPLLRVMDALPRAARQVAEASGKRVEVVLGGSELELDRAILDRLGDPLLHLVRNAVDHGIETPERRRDSGKPDVGRIRIEARRERDAIQIEVCDDGAGVDLKSVLKRAVDSGLVHPDLAEDLPPDQIVGLVFRPGISTAESVSRVSGRGVGMDAVRASIESLGGSVEMHTESGSGTRAVLSVPISAAVQRVLLVGLAEEQAALPVGKLERILELPSVAVERSGGEAFAVVDDVPLPVFDLASRLGLGRVASRPTSLLVLTEVRGERVAFEVDRFAGQQEIYVKPVPALLRKLKALAGLTVLGDGRPVFLLDLNQLA